jgi:transcriptional regulator with XRE-family HTH domain/tetratricopeptide (TPR) repeat protein
MTTELGTWLRTQREERGWSRNEMARRLIAAARETGDTAMPDADTVRGYIYRWEHGKASLSERYVLHYCRAFGIKPAQFGLQPQPEPAPGLAVIQPAVVIPAEAGVPYCRTVAYRGIEAHESTQSTVRHEVLMAAHEGSDHAEQAERRDFGDATLEQLHADVARLSAELMTGDPFSMFLDMRRVRDRVYRLLEGHLRPGDQAELYFLIGCLNDLMAGDAASLGYPQAAEELIRAGWAYANAIGNRPLMAHLRLQLASIMLWDGQFRRARDLADDGLRYLDAGPTGVNLYLKSAQAAARTGDADGARRALTEARDARDRPLTDDVAAIGGEFGLSAATEHYFAGSALILIDDAASEAAGRLEEALSLYEAGPGPSEQHWFGAKAMTGIDLATVQLRTGALDAAVATIEPALSLPSARRINALMPRLQLVRTELAAPVFRGSAQARELDERIEEFGRDSVTAGLHSLPAGPA